MDASTLPSSTAAYGALQAFNSSRPSATDYISKANSQYNIPADQQQVTGLQGTLNNLNSSLQAVAPSVQGRTSGTFTTAGQQSALINKEQAPIATNINSTGTSLGQAQGVQSHDEQLAAQMVQALLGSDATKYQGLMDTYGAATDAEKSAEQKREFDAQAAEQAREFNLTPRGLSGSDTQSIIDAIKAAQGGGGGATNPADQASFNDVLNRIKTAGNNTDALISDYAATKVSADRGNAGDKAKLQAYALNAPSLFGNGGSALSKVNALVSGWGKPAATSKTPVATPFVNKVASPGSFSVFNPSFLRL